MVKMSQLFGSFNEYVEIPVYKDVLPESHQRHNNEIHPGFQYHKKSIPVERYMPKRSSKTPRTKESSLALS